MDGIEDNTPENNNSPMFSFIPQHSSKDNFSSVPVILTRQNIQAHDDASKPLLQLGRGPVLRIGDVKCSRTQALIFSTTNESGAPSLAAKCMGKATSYVRRNGEQYHMPRDSVWNLEDGDVIELLEGKYCLEYRDHTKEASLSQADTSDLPPEDMPQPATPTLPDNKQESTLTSATEAEQDAKRRKLCTNDNGKQEDCADVQAKAVEEEDAELAASLEEEEIALRKAQMEEERLLIDDDETFARKLQQQFDSEFQNIALPTLPPLPFIQPEAPSTTPPSTPQTKLPSASSTPKSTTITFPPYFPSFKATDLTPAHFAPPVNTVHTPTPAPVFSTTRVTGPTSAPTVLPSFSDSVPKLPFFNPFLPPLPALPATTTTTTRIAYTANNEPNLSDQDIEKLLDSQSYDNLAEADTPEDLKVPLYPYQKQALTWMKEREKKEPAGGILADDMGIGKTIETLATIMANKRTGKPQSTLIVAPVSCVMNWKREITTKLKSVPNLHIYHGPNKVTSAKKLSKFDIVITTYNTLGSDFIIDKNDPTKIEFGPSLLVKWYRIVLDEAHCIKNRKTRAAKACFALQAKIRWALSGTPIQNSLDDMYSLINFLRYEPYSEYTVWKQSVVQKIFGNAEAGFNKLRAVLQPIVLKRTKNKMINGKPILVLPDKYDTQQEDVFSPEESDFYQALWKSSVIQFNKYLKAGTVMQNYSNILVLLLRLRQACNHPILVLNSRVETSEVAPRTLPQELQDRIKTEEGSDCSICLDVRQDPHSTQCGHVFCKECIMTRLETKTECPLCRQSVSVDQLIPLKEALGELDMSVPDSQLSKYDDSTKMKRLIEHLEKMRQTDPNAKAVVFSQWTSMLDLVGESLKKRNFKTTRFDGSMSMSQRGHVLGQFNDDPETTVLLMSLKAGGVGINLVVANYTFLLDLWWNPAVEEQAVDRLHRVGQTKAVNIVRFTIKETIENKILSLQEKKKKIADGALGTGRFTNVGRLTLDDLKYLFQN